MCIRDSCHVESSPKRTEMMDRPTATRCLELLKASPAIKTLDITGGAPELNSQFRYLVEEASKLGVEIIDRCNLTVLMEPGQEDLPEFLAKHKVRHLPLLLLPCTCATVKHAAARCLGALCLCVLCGASVTRLLLQKQRWWPAQSCVSVLPAA